METLKEAACVAARVRDRQPQAQRSQVGKEALGHLPDGVRNTGRFVELDHHADLAVCTGERVRVLFRPRLCIGVVILGVHLQLVLDQRSEPLRRSQAHGTLLEPVAVDAHGVPLTQLGHGSGAQLCLGVGGHDGSGPDPAGHDPHVQHGQKRRLTDPATRANRQINRRRPQPDALALEIEQHVLPDAFELHLLP